MNARSNPYTADPAALQLQARVAARVAGALSEASEFEIL